MQFSPHIAIQVKDYENAVKFFEQMLQMELLKKGEKESHFKKNGINFYVEHQPECKAYFEFYTNDINPVILKLEESVCILKATRTPELEKSYLVYTPFGFQFHLWEKKAEQSEC